MNYRTASIFAAKDLGESGTEVIPIRIREPISRLNITYKTIKVADGMDDFAHANITKIELVDGSDVLFSMDGGECQALNIYDRRCPTMNEGVHFQNNADVTTFGIDFGRFLHDPELAFDPGKFANPQLKITYDEDVSDILGGTGILEVWADVFDEKVITPIGFLMSKNIWSGAKPTSGYEYVELPTDYPIRKLLLKALKKDSTPWDLVDELRLDEENEKRIPLDWNLEKYYLSMRGVWAPVEEPFVAQFALNKTYYLTPTDYWAILLARSNEAATYMYGGAASNAGGTFKVNSFTGNVQFSGIARGYLPNGCFEFPFGDPKDINDWYDVTRLGNLRLRLHAGIQDPTEVAVITQQLRRY